MTVATSLPEQGQLVSVHSRQWIVKNVRPSTLTTLALKPIFNAARHLLVTASVENDLPRLIDFGESPPELRAVRVVANEAAQEERFVIPQNMRVPASSVIRSLFEVGGEQDAASLEDLGD